MTSKTIWIAITVGVFFAGIGVSYAHFASTYDPMSMKFQNQELFNQMMSNNPKMSQQWMDSGMTSDRQIVNIVDSTSEPTVNPLSASSNNPNCDTDQGFVENNLSGKNLTGCDLSYMVIDRTSLRDALVSDSDLTGVQIYNSNLDGVNLSNSVMSGSLVSNSLLSNSNLENIILSGSMLGGVDMSNSNIQNSDLRGVDLTGANLDGVVLFGSDMRGSDMRGASLVNADLSKTNLTGADLSGANLQGALLDGADLTGAILYCANHSVCISN